MSVRCFAAGCLSFTAMVSCAAPALADDAPRDEVFAVHAQATMVAQGVFGFSSPYQGGNSLQPRDLEETVDATLYLGVRPWKGAELWADPEVDQGFGLSNTLGVAGFTSAEAYKVGKDNPYVRLQRLFFRQTIDLGGQGERVDGTANQLAGSRSANRLVFTLGKFSVGDVFDTNKYAHDPRGDFLNWALVDTGSFDYAADAWGYTYGAAAEWYQGAWALRLGALNLSTVPNTTSLEKDFSQNELVAEVEHRHAISSHAGAIRLSVFRNHGRFARLADATAMALTTGTMPDLATLRQYRDRWGGTLNVEQEVTGDLGLFLRAGYTDGSLEAYDFTDIDRTLALGGALKGASWGRGRDTVGLAGVVNAISRDRQRFLDAGGLGILVGDGKLPHPGDEWIAEAYYSAQITRGFSLTVDYQFVANPGYNRDRGPANVLGVRFHGAF